MPVGARFSALVRAGPGAHPASYTIGTGSLPGGKANGACRWSPTQSSAEVKERAELYLSSPSEPSWPVLGLNLPFFYEKGYMVSTQDYAQLAPSISTGFNNCGKYQCLAMPVRQSVHHTELPEHTMSANKRTFNALSYTKSRCLTITPTCFSAILREYLFNCKLLNTSAGLQCTVCTI